MRTLLLVVMAVLALPCHAAERQFWGPTVNGLRLSVALETGQTLQITIGNAGPVERRIPIGGMTGIGPICGFQFAAISPEGKRHKMFYTGGAGFVGGYVSPLIASILPGFDYKIQLPLTKFWVMGGSKESLKQLIDAGWAVEASIEVKPGEVAPGEVTPEQAGPWSPSRWTGKLVSGEMRY